MAPTLKRLGLHCALAAMLLRAVLPAGWMPNTSASLTVPLVICTMNGPVRAMVTLGDQPDKRDPDHRPGHNDGRQPSVCPFAAAVQLAVPTSAATLIPSQATALLTPPAPRAVRLPARYRLPSPRAPPATA